MASKLSKEDYNKVLSAEYGFPVFLTDKEYARIQTERPAPEMKAAGYRDPEARIAHKPAAPTDEERAARWTTQPGVTYNKEHGRAPLKDRYAGFEAGPSKPFLNASKDAGPAPKKAEKIEKLQMPEAPKAAPSWGPALTAETSMPVGKPVAPGWVTPKQDTFAAKDFGIPMTGDPISAKAPASFEPYPAGAVGAIQAALPPTPEGPRWMSEEDEWAKDMAKYNALLAGK